MDVVREVCGSEGDVFDAGQRVGIVVLIILVQLHVHLPLVILPSETNHMSVSFTTLLRRHLSARSVCEFVKMF